MAIDKKSDEKVFMKMFALKKDDENKYDMKEFQNEVKLFTRLRLISLFFYLIILSFFNFILIDIFPY